MARKKNVNKKIGEIDAKLGALLSAQASQKKKKKNKKAQVSGSGAYAYGRGKYSLGKALGGAIGGALGTAVGMPNLGVAGGRMAGGMIQRRVQGRGKYVVNDLVNGMAAEGTIPVFGVPDENGTVRIRHKEYIADIFSPATPANFVSQTFSLNPGLAGVFPWLSQTAANYDEYEFKGLIFTYNPVISDSSNSGAMGTVIVATQYNAANSAFASKQQMLEYSGSVSARICDTIVHGVECDPRKHGGSAIEYVRAGAVPSGQDVKTYDLGLFQISTSGVSSGSFPAGTQLGELWVSYDIELRKPKFWDNLGYSILTDSFYGITGSTTTLPLGTAPLKSGLNSIGGTLTKAGSTVYTFPDNFVGYVRVHFHITAATSSSVTTNDIVRAGNIATASFYTQDGTTNTDRIVQAGGAGTPSIVEKLFQVSTASAAGGNTLTFTATSIVGAVSACQVIIGEINPLNGVPLTAGGLTSNYVAV